MSVTVVRHGGNTLSRYTSKTSSRHIKGADRGALVRSSATCWSFDAGALSAAPSLEAFRLISVGLLLEEGPNMEIKRTSGVFTTFTFDLGLGKFVPMVVAGLLVYVTILNLPKDHDVDYEFEIAGHVFHIHIKSSQPTPTVVPDDSSKREKKPRSEAKKTQATSAKESGCSWGRPRASS